MGNNSDESHDTNTEDTNVSPGFVKFNYIKSNLFRVIHSDGIWGGLTPRLDLQVAFWNERAPIAQETTHELKPGNMLGDEIEAKRVIKDGIVREVEVNVIMNLANAKFLHKWLGEKIELIESHLKDHKEKGDAT